ncbi:hypothetical protein F4778DRAFT_287702 [Xylariomycetidae sp. FL2044]|nr:hypothetical protein F4778DRAFT_287702 [Xylariomycetidae sp. FL2044]
MSPLNGKRITNAKLILGHPHRLTRIIKKLSKMRLGNSSDDDDQESQDSHVDNDDQSSQSSTDRSDNPALAPHATDTVTATTIATATTTIITTTTPTITITTESPRSCTGIPICHDDKIQDVDELSHNPAWVSSEPAALPTEKPKVSGLLLLPQELFDEITSYLHPANIAVLALVNKELMGRFMRSTPNPNPSAPDAPPSWKALNAFIKKADTNKTKARGSLLSLLDYDLLDLVYCYKCKKMHDPFVTFKHHAFAPQKAARCADWAPDHHMPPRATRKLLRTITKRRKHGEEYRYLLQQVNNTVTTYKMGVMVQATLRMRYRDNLMLMRRQQVVSSIDKTPLSLWLFARQLQDYAPTHPRCPPSPRVFRICNHMTWYDTYGVLMDQLLKPLIKEPYTPDMDGRLTGVPASCFSSDVFDCAKEEGHMIAERLETVSRGIRLNPMNMPTLLGDVLGCEKCTTDFSIDVVPLPAPFHWGFALTTWLDLGPLDFCGKWDSHRDARPGREYKRKVAHGDICQRFEDLSSSRLDYRPQIKQVDQQRMGNYGWGERAARGWDKYVSWSSGHACDPMTGFLMEPDPLEEADY